MLPKSPVDGLDVAAVEPKPPKPLVVPVVPNRLLFAVVPVVVEPKMPVDDV